MDLDKLLYLQGVGNGFTDCNGVYHETPTSEREYLLRTMCYEQLAQVSAADYPQWVASRIDELDAQPWTKLLRPLQWADVEHPVVTFQVPAQFSGKLTLTLSVEQQAPILLTFDVQAAHVSGDYFTRGQTYLERKLLLAPLLAAIDEAVPSMGYHQLNLAYADDTSSAEQGVLLLAPAQVYGADLARIAPQKRPWGVSLQVFSLWNAAANEAIPTAFGDFAALADTIKTLAAQGADFLLLNPLHALPLHEPEAASPYSPYDRRRLHCLYISPSLSAEGQNPLWHELLPKRMPKADKGDWWVDYTQAAHYKAAELKAMFKVFDSYPADHPRRLAFTEFLDAEGAALQHYAIQQAAEAKTPWLKNSEFYCYLQFVAEEQLALCQQLASDSGMAIGLIRDLAVGAVGSGVEVSQETEQFCTRASIGAPPDPFAPQGQNWGLTPLDPIGLKQHNFQHFIEMLRCNMRHCGALRIDHFMGLFRLWWWPIAESGQPQPAGAYIYYPFELMMAILRLESHRAACMVIGEDLGIVPPEIKAPMTDAGIYSNELFYFCSDGYRYPQYAGFKAPHDYKSHALMMLANHDVPTMAAWWQGQDLLKRHELNLLSQQELQQAQTEREQQRQGVLHWLKDMAGWAESDTTLDAILPAWAKTVASGNSQLYSIALADLLAEVDAINIPGTSSEYPNWRRRYSVPVSQFAAKNLFVDVLTAVRSVRNTHN